MAVESLDQEHRQPVAPAPPQAVELPDIRAITIRISPPLTNVRLVDVLDAIVRVADTPIKYTITDYAVVISFRNPHDPGEAP